MVTHSSNLAWEAPWTEEPSGLQSVGHYLTPKQQQPSTQPCQNVLF